MKNVGIKGGSWDSTTGYFNRTIAICLLLFLLITIVPLFLPWLSSTKFSLEVFGAGWSHRTISLLGRSLLLAAGSASLAIFLGFPIGIGLWNNSTIVYKLRGAILVALLLPPYLFAQGWMALSMSPPPGMSFLQTPTGFGWTVFLMGTAFSPLAAIILGMARYFLPAAAMESAAIHFSPVDQFKKIVFPLLLPFIGATWLLIAMLVVLEGGVPLTLQLPVFATEITSRFMAGENAGRLILSMWPLPLLAAILGCAGLSLLSGRTWPSSDRISQHNHPTLKPAKLPGMMRFYLYSGWILFFTMLALPLTGLIRQSIGHTASLMNLSADGNALLWTLFIGATSAVISAAIAIPIGALIATGKRFSMAMVLFLPVTMPASMIGIAWATMGAKLNATVPFFPESLPIIMAHTARILPFTLIVTSLAWKRFSCPNAREAVFFNQSHWRQRLALELPLISLSILTAAVLSIRELEISLLTVPPGGQTLPIRVFNLLHYGAGADVCRLSLLLALFLAIGAILLMRRWEK